MATTVKGLSGLGRGRRRCRVALETGTHSPWVSRLLEGLGQKVAVARKRAVRLHRLGVSPVGLEAQQQE